MEIEKSIFYRMTNENEDSTTELLANILRSYLFIRSDIIKHLCGDYQRLIGYDFDDAEIVTQRVVEGIGKPDLKIKTKDVYVIVENKIRVGTTPTEHELVDYIKEIEAFCSSSLRSEGSTGEKKYGKLVFLIPQEYGFVDLFRRVYDSYPSLVSIVYWENFISWIKKREYSSASPVLAEVISYFESVVDINHKNEDTRELRAYEVLMLNNVEKVFDAISLCNQLLKRIAAIETRLIENLNDEFKSKEIPVELSASNYFFDYSDNNKVPQINDGGIGKALNITYRGKRYDMVCYCGFSDLNDRKKTKDYGFSVAFYKIVSSGLTAYTTETSDNWTFVPLNPEILIDPDTSLFEKEVTEIVKNVIESPDFAIGK